MQFLLCDIFLLLASVSQSSGIAKHTMTLSPIKKKKKNLPADSHMIVFSTSRTKQLIIDLLLYSG